MRRWPALAASAAGALAALAAVFLAGGREQGGLGIWLAVSGAAMIAVRPRLDVGWRVVLCVFLLTASGFLALLPQAWFGLPDWRAALVATGEVPLPGSVSPQPALTLFWAVVLAAVGCFGLFLMANPLRSHHLAWVCALYVAGAAAYALWAIGAEQWGWSYPFDGGPTFGFFPNRNHTATLLASGALAGFGLVFQSCRDRRWLPAILATGCVAVLLAGLLGFSISRAGLLMLAGGGSLWLAGLSGRFLDRRVAACAAVLALCLAAVFLSGESPLKRRMADYLSGGGTGAGAVETPRDGRDTAPRTAPLARRGLGYRALIYEDTLGMAAAFPITGVGLGAFAQIFPHYREASLLEAQCVHPESDWLMALAECGVLAPAMLGCLLWLATRNLRGRNENPYWPVRWGMACAFFAAMGHALIDVPFHRVVLGCALVWLAAAALSPPARGAIEGPRPARAWRWIFPAAGVAMVLFGLQLIRAEWFGARAFPPFRWAQLDARIRELVARRDYEPAIEVAAQAIREMPLNHQAYYWKAACLLRFEETDAEAARLLHAARLIKPDWPRLCMDQARLWRGIDERQAAALEREALVRALRIDRAHGAGPEAWPVSAAFLGEILRQSPADRETAEALAAQVRDIPQLRVEFIAQASTDAARAEFARIGDPAAFLAALPPPSARRVMEVWLARLDPGGATTFLEEMRRSNPQAFGPFWPALARTYAQNGQYQQAAELALATGEIPDGKSWRTPAVAGLSPLEMELQALWVQRNTVAIERILSERAAGDRPERGALEAKAAFHAERGEWREAWSAIDRWLRLRESGR